MDDKTKIDLAKAEYLQLQTIIDAFDSRAFTIKAWSVSFSLAAVAGAFATHADPLFLVAALSALLFWVVEANWKLIQTSFYDRCDELEEFFAGKNDSLVPMQIGTCWVKQYRSTSRMKLIAAMRRSPVALPHVAVLLISVTLYCASCREWITV